MLRFFLLAILALFQVSSDCQTVLWDAGWRFQSGDIPSAEQPEMDDASWRLLNLPHDWSIEDLPGIHSPFSTASVGGVNTGFSVGGTSWYRKHFTVPAGTIGQPVYVQFDGVYMNAAVWINGHHLGNHPYGYTSFYYDLGPYLQAGKNTLAVRVENEGKNSRWYSGSGIYRHVWLKYKQPVHIQPWGVHVTTPQVSAAKATVLVKTRLQQDTGSLRNLNVFTRIIDPSGVQVAAAASRPVQTAGNTGMEAARLLTVAHPRRWSVETPYLYTTIVQVYRGTRLLDSDTTRFGIRSISFSAGNGFQLNGKPVKLKGGCVHHDHGPLGAAAWDRAEERKIELLKASGYNAVRCSHNPPAPAFLDACDRLGMLVIDEAFDTWRDRKNKEDYHLYFTSWWQRDLESMVVRDRNHPSVIMWSIGNEIPNRDKPEVVAVADSLHQSILQLDTTRPVTCGVNGVEENKDPFFSKLDIAGYNYAPDRYEPDHQRLPNRIMYATESYPLEAYVYWKAVERHPYVIGDFVWTAWDYIGEAGIGWLGYPQKREFYPWNLAYCGDIDVCGWKRPQSYYRDVLWKNNQLSLWITPPVPTFPLPTFRQEPWSRWNWQDVQSNWNWPGYEDSLLDVTAYANCEAVELFLNGRSLGRKTADTASRYLLTWKVPYNKGVLKAIGYSRGKQVNTAILQTAGQPVQTQLQADRQTIKADGQDLSYVTVTLTDDKGIKHPAATNHLQFSISGPGRIIGVGNADPTSTESFTTPERKAWQGRCLVIVQSSGGKGPIRLTASGTGLKEGHILITAARTGTGK